MRVTGSSLCHIRITLLQDEYWRVVVFLFSTEQTAVQQMKCLRSFRKLNFAQYLNLKVKLNMFSVSRSGRLDSGDVGKMESAKE